MTDYLLVAGLVAVYLWLHFSGKRKKKGLKKTKAADWFTVKKVDSDGLIYTEDDRYFYMIEVLPISFVLKSTIEQKIIWSTFRDFINAIPHPLRFKTESHPYKLEDYFEELAAEATDTGDVNNIEYVEEQRLMFTAYLERNQISDRYYYVFLETDNRYLNDMGAEFSNPLLNDILRKNSAKNSSQDIDTARQELTNSTRICEGALRSIGMSTNLMDRKEVLKYLYRSGNREISSLITLEEMINRTAEENETLHSFSKMHYTKGASAQ
ncbi:hypothetical protein HGO21_16360 [Acinetobacter sp. CUI P1]|nr:hypothetical protein [Acinetobacter sp. CUI P1]